MEQQTKNNQQGLWSKKQSRSRGLPVFGIAKGDRGFTLVEVMVAMSIFAVLVTMGMQAILSAMTQHRLTQSVRTVMDSLNFVMEDMARNIRLGTNMHCVLPSDPPLVGMPTPNYFSADTNVYRQSCPVGSNMLVFNGVTHTGGSTPVGGFITYVFTSPLSSTPNVVIKQKGEDPTTAEVITPPEVSIDFTRSGFQVRGAEWGADAVADFAQPTVLIRLSGVINTNGITTPFSLQTTVTPRAVDP